MRIIISLALIFMLASCGAFKRDGKGLFQDETQRALPFKAKISSSKEDRRAFSVVVQSKGADLDATRESVRYPASRYCLYSFGNTQIRWDMDASGEEWQGAVNGDQTTYSGRCIAR